MAAVPLGLAGILPLVLACAGAGLVLAFPGGPACRLLAHPVPVGIGLVSYSAYLWHQPLLAFARIRFGHLDPPPAIALGGLALLLAWPTWRYVETPFRRPGGAPPARPSSPPPPPSRSSPPSAPQARSPTASPSAPPPRFGDHGVGLRHQPVARHLQDRPRPGQPDPSRPRLPPRRRAPGGRLLGRQPRRRPAGRSLRCGEAAGFRFYSVTRSACPPVPGLTRTGPAASPACDDFVRGVEDLCAARRRRGRVIAARWISGVATDGFDNGEGGVEGDPGDFLTPRTGATDQRRRPPGPRHRPLCRRRPEPPRRGLRVVLVYPVPEAGWNVPEELARRRAASAVPVTLSTDHAAYLRRQAPILAAFDAIDDPASTAPAPPTRSATASFPAAASTAVGDQPLYFDDDHVNMTGARLVAPVILAAIEAARRDAWRSRPAAGSTDAFYNPPPGI